MKITPTSALLLLLLADASFAATSERTYSLYCNSIMDESMRFQVATFDSTDGEAYNRENCEQASSLFKAQSGGKTKLWSESADFKK